MQAAARLVEIIRSDSAPVSFVFSLFLDLLPLLNGMPFAVLRNKREIDLMNGLKQYLRRIWCCSVRKIFTI